MVGSKCAFNSAPALRRVFIPSNLDTTSCLHVTRIFVPALLPPAQQQQARVYSKWWNSQTKPFAGSWASDPLSELYQKNRSRTQAAPTLQPQRPPRSQPPKNLDKPGPRVATKLARLPRDDEIRQPYVHFMEMSFDGVEGLSEPRSVREILARLDRKTESLEVQSLPESLDPESLKWPLAKIVNKKEELARKQKEKERQKKQASANKEKELEFNWALAPNDIEHKLRTLKRFLAKGWKVQLLLLRKAKKGVKATSTEDAEALLQKIVEATADVPGSKEYKSREGKLLGSMKIFLQGKLQEKVDEKPTNAGEDNIAEQSA